MASFQELTQPSKTIAKDLVSQLRHHAAQNKLFNAVMHRFAIRERARAQVTIQTLKATMESEGFGSHKDAEYGRVLEILSDLGVGTLKKDKKGKIQALTHIKLRLQSIGKAALNQGEKVENFQPNTMYANLMHGMESKLQPTDTTQYAAVLTVMISGRAVNFPLPPIMGGDLGFLLADLYSGGSGQGTKGRA